MPPAVIGRYGLVLPVDGVLRNPSDDSVLLGNFPLIEALRGGFSLALLADEENERIIEHWLMVNKQIGYTYLVRPSQFFSRSSEVTKGAIRKAQLDFLSRNRFPITFYLDSDIDMVDMMRHEGVDTLLLPGKAGGADFSLAPTPWNDLVEKIKRESAEQAFDLQVEMGEGRFNG
jgi:hypothetical protein